MQKKDALYLETRRNIYNSILKNPGLHFREFCRKTKIPATTLRYHIRYLKNHGFIEIKPENGYTRYFVAKKVSGKDKQILNLFRQDIPRTIILLLLICPGYSQIELIKYVETWKKHPSKIGVYLNKHQTTISYYLRKLESMEIIETLPNGNETKYRIKNPELVYDLIITYEKSIVNETTNRIIKYILYPQKDTINLVVDSFTKTVFDIFPHPYHA